MQPHACQEFINRFVAACQADERVIAATLYGSHARGTADAYSDLQATCCPLEPSAMLEAAHCIVRFYLELAPALAQAHDIAYPAGLERVMSERLQRLADEG